MLGKHIKLGDRLIVKTDKPVKNIRTYKNKLPTQKVKMTFYIERNLLNKLYNCAFWERLTLTDAFNTALKDGLIGKNTMNRTNK